MILYRRKTNSTVPDLVPLSAEDLFAEKMKQDRELSRCQQRKLRCWRKQDPSMTFEEGKERAILLNQRLAEQLRNPRVPTPEPEDAKSCWDIFKSCCACCSDE